MVWIWWRKEELVKRINRNPLSQILPCKFTCCFYRFSMSKSCLIRKSFISENLFGSERVFSLPLYFYFTFSPFPPPLVPIPSPLVPIPPLPLSRHSWTGCKDRMCLFDGFNSWEWIFSYLSCKPLDRPTVSMRYYLTSIHMKEYASDQSRI